MSNSSSQRANPLVSVVIPVYNGGQYFDKCLEGVLNQTYQNWECIINNNCSKDDTLLVANKYAAKDDRFKVYTNENFISMVENWNLACTKISDSSKYLKVLGADDWLFPESLEKKVALMEQNPSVGLCSSYRLNDEIVDMYGLNIWDGNIFNGKKILYGQLNHVLDITGSNSTILFSLEHLKKLPRYPVVFDSATIHEDTELAYEIMNHFDVGFVFQVLSYTRRHAGAATSTTVYRYKTLLHLNEKVLWDYKGDDKKLNQLYKACRLDYAYFMVCKTISLDLEAVNWHKQRMVRKLKFHEYVLGLLTRNKIVYLIQKLFRKIFQSK